MERFDLTRILSERATSRFGIIYPSHLVTLVNICGATPDNAEKVVWGEPAEMSLLALAKVAAVFDLDEGLLGCLLAPVSEEGVRHTISRKIAELDDFSCPGCQLIIDAHERQNVLYALLQHRGHSLHPSPVEKSVSGKVLSLLDLAGPAPIGDISNILQIEEDAILWIGQKVEDLSGSFAFDSESGIVTIDVEKRHV